ncbi:hypothetical protein [Ralstonia pseudosolanacearum]|uniref:hypothetical protein n=1 Tax=Ralstonia pseudosolanacearum TaxID=1310165 RepID=UPI0004903AF9|nr:hypothetical protein [Ralstonia pseudosolanacearum]MDO3559432.1 hypothetical protein [Ralstonia pseudosolanacearum]MDO3579078.1 hypothetical protein [Ralstonia pseudosolanacearum]MDO3588755.1 hypothetical protein [Ralstonia pseudosolanacearum]
MKVVLKETVYDRIKKRLYEAYCNGREVDYIVVTPGELNELLCDRRADSSVQSKYTAYNWAPAAEPSVLSLTRREFVGRNGRRYYTYSNYTFRDIDLFVVPEEYHPQ